jgi:hypothetical protein
MASSESDVNMTTPGFSRLSALTDIPETPNTSAPSDSRSQEYPQLLNAPNPARIGQLLGSSSHSDDTFNSLQALIISMQHDLQVQLQTQQHDFEVRIRSLLIEHGKLAQPAVPDNWDRHPSTSPSALPQIQDSSAEEHV